MDNVKYKSWEELYQAYRSGAKFAEEDLFEQLFVVTPKLLFSIDSSLSPEDMEEICSRVLEKLVKTRLRSYKGDAKLTTWLRSIICNERCDYFRQLKRYRDVVDRSLDAPVGTDGSDTESFYNRIPGKELPASDVLSYRLTIKDVQELIADMNDIDQAVLAERILYGEKSPQIAEKLGLNVSLVHLRFHRARRGLAEAMLERDASYGGVK